MSVTKKLLTVTAIVVVIAAGVGIGYKASHRQVVKQPVQAPDTSSTSVAAPQNIYKDDVFKLVNDQRIQNGLPALTDDPRLDASALDKCNDMAAKDYFAHDTPSGQTPYVFMINEGVSYHYAGENLAFGFHTSQDIVTGWMNSPTHRFNILNSHYTAVGTAVCSSNNYQGKGYEVLTVQHFIGV